MSLRAEILENASQISLAATEEVKQKKLCEIWPQAVLALQILATTIKNPVVKGVISIVTTAGDAVVKSICK